MFPDVRWVFTGGQCGHDGPIQAWDHLLIRILKIIRYSEVIDLFLFHHFSCSHFLAIIEEYSNVCYNNDSVSIKNVDRSTHWFSKDHNKDEF